MGDSQIWNPAVADAESVYQVTGDVRFILKAVNADFIDNGAASGWLPAVVIGSDAGHVIARAVDQAVAVAGGDDAAVSWFPGVKHAAGGGSALDLPWAFGAADLRSNSTNATYFQTATTDSALFSYDAGTKRWLVFEGGTYLLFIHAVFQEAIATVPAATRFSMASTFTNVGGGHPVTELLNHPLQAGVLEFSGTAARWDLNEMFLISLDPSQVALRFTTSATASSGANRLAGLSMGIVRISTTALLNPF